MYNATRTSKHPKNLVPVDENGKIIEGASIAEVKEVRPRTIFKGKDGKTWCINDRKHDYFHRKVFRFKDQSLGGVLVEVEVSRRIDNGHENFIFKFNDDGAIQEVRVSKILAYRMMQAMYSDFHGTGTSNPSDNDLFGFLNNEGMVMSLLVHSPDYSIVKSDLVDAGMSSNTASNVRQVMVKAGKLKVIGKVGNRQIYTCTIPKQDFMAFFNDKHESVANQYDQQPIPDVENMTVDEILEGR